MATPLPSSPGSWLSPDAASARKSLDAAAARKSLSSRRPPSGFMRGTSKDLGALVRDSRRNLSDSGRTLPGAEAGGRGMVLPFTPLNLTFHHLSYYVDLPKVGHRQTCLGVTCKCTCAYPISSEQPSFVKLALWHEIPLWLSV